MTDWIIPCNKTVAEAKSRTQEAWLLIVDFHVGETMVY